MIQVKKIKKSYGPLQVLKGVDLTIGEKEIVTIVGASGAGKSTLLHIIGTLDSPDSGELWFENTNIATFSPKFTALENVCMPAWIKGKSGKEAEKKAITLLELMGLKERISHKPNELSGGEQQRVSVARALVNDPKIILADEPSGNLDTLTKNELHRLFFTLREELGQTFVIVTHDTGLAEMSDRQIHLKDGKIIA